MGQRQRDGGRPSHHADVMYALRRGRGRGALISSFYQCRLAVAGNGTSLNSPAHCASDRYCTSSKHMSGNCGTV